MNLSTPASPYKNLTLGILVSLIACFLPGCFGDAHPKFKVGDCVQWDDTERWQKDNIWKITEIGKKRYRIVYTDKYLEGRDIYAGVTSIKFADENLEKVECPK